MAEPAVAADLHQALDGLRALAPEVALDGVIAVEQVAQLGDLVVRQVADVGTGLIPSSASIWLDVGRPTP